MLGILLVVNDYRHLLMSLHAVVDRFVHVQVARLGERFGAARVRALVRLLSCMDPDVSF